MAGVQVASFAWGYCVDRETGRPRPGALHIIDTDVFEDAALTVPLSGPYETNDEGLLPGFIEAGVYHQTDPDGDTIQVEAYSGADSGVIAGYEGRLVTVESGAVFKVVPATGQEVYRDTFGTYELAAVLSVIANSSGAPETKVLGTADPSTYPDRDSVSLFVDNRARAPIVSSSSTTFTATSVTFGGGVDVSGVLVGMIVDVGNAPWTVGTVTAINGQTLTVGSWRQSGAGADTPSNGTAAKIGQITKLWALNANVYKQAAGFGTKCVGFEIGVFSDEDDADAGLSQGSAYTWGMDVVDLSTGRGTIAYNARGHWAYGFASSGMYGAGAHFAAHRNWDTTPDTTSYAAFLDDDANVDTSFKAQKSAAYPRVFSVLRTGDSANRFQMSRDGGMEWGPGNAAVDSNLYRSGVGTITSDGTLVAGVNVIAAGIVAANGSGGASFFQAAEQSSDPAGVADYARIYAKDNGSGKTQLVVRFGSGAVQVLATQP